MILDLVAEVVASGAAPARALSVVAECLATADPEASTELVELAAALTTGTSSATSSATSAVVAPAAGGTRRSARPRFPALAAAVELAAATGAGPVGLMQVAAQQERHRVWAARTRAARRAGVLVLLPTGLCLLPAFVLLTVVPLVVDLVLG